MCIAPFSLGLRNLHFNIDVPVELFASPASDRKSVNPCRPVAAEVHTRTHTTFATASFAIETSGIRHITCWSFSFFPSSFPIVCETTNLTTTPILDFPLLSRFDLFSFGMKYSVVLTFTIHKFIHCLSIHRNTAVQFTAGYVLGSWFAILLYNYFLIGVPGGSVDSPVRRVERELQNLITR